MLLEKEVLSKKALCDLFGVANIGGISVNNSRGLIVLVSNHTDPTYRNEWRGDILHFAGMGTFGSHKLDRQKKTLAGSKRRGYAIHLFEVRERSRYLYVGEFELADEPYCDAQPDVTAQERFVWIFALRRKPAAACEGAEVPEDYLPKREHAMIASELDDAQRRMVEDGLNRLQACVRIHDERHIIHDRSVQELANWSEAVMNHIRASVKQMIVDGRHEAKAIDHNLVDGELDIESDSGEGRVRHALLLLGYKETKYNELFAEATEAIPLPMSLNERLGYAHSDERLSRRDKFKDWR